MYYGFFNPMFLLFVAPGMALGAYAAWLVKSRAKEMATDNLCGLTGAEVAQRILDANGITDVRIEKIPGELTDFYHPSQKRLALSEAVHDKRTITAMGVAAHEVGHALQDKQSYAPLMLRQSVAPFAIHAQKGATFLLMGGFLLGGIVGAGVSTWIIHLSCILFAVAVVFALVTLPVEFNASSRAVNELARLQLSGGAEWDKTKKVLNAAALTYVASAAVAIGTFLYMLMRAQAQRR